MSFHAKIVSNVIISGLGTHIACLGDLTPNYLKSGRRKPSPTILMQCRPVFAWRWCYAEPW
jgi:hypothetical protein